MREIPEGRLNERVKAVWRLSGAILALVLGAAIFGTTILLMLAADPPIGDAMMFGIAALLTALLFVLFVAVMPPIRYARWRFAVLEDEIDIYRGIIVRKRIIVPLIRVQFTDTTQGPLMRAFGLAAVAVYTAAAPQSIGGLAVAEAEALRDKVAVLAKQVQEDV